MPRFYTDFTWRTSDVGDDDPVPSTFQLSQNYPNPFNPGTNIAFTIKQSGHVSIDVYNLAGQKVRNLTSANYAAGEHVVTWDGTDSKGSMVSSGVYFYKMETGEFSETRKMVVLK
jgi:Tol biopolymer transport system component